VPVASSLYDIVDVWKAGGGSDIIVLHTMVLSHTQNLSLTAIVKRVFESCTFHSHRAVYYEGCMSDADVVFSVKTISRCYRQTRCMELMAKKVTPMRLSMSSRRLPDDD